MQIEIQEQINSSIPDKYLIIINDDVMFFVNKIIPHNIELNLYEYKGEFVGFIFNIDIHDYKYTYKIANRECIK